VLNTSKPTTIRGIRNLYGTSKKLGVYFKDNSINNGSGGKLRLKILNSPQFSQQSIKGAASSVYGAGLGGVIHLKSAVVLLYRI
jgi:iron complex outermembrane receptor protein